MSAIEIMIRTAGATTAVLLGVALLRIREATWIERINAMLLCLGVASYLLYSNIAVLCSPIYAIPVVLLAGGVPSFFWVWTRSIMDDDFQLTALPIVFSVMLIGCSVAVVAARDPAVISASISLHSVIGIGFILASLVEVLRTWQQDLIEARRRVRIILLVMTGGYALTILTVEWVLRTTPPSTSLQIFNATILTLMLGILAITLLTMSGTVRIAFGWNSPIDLPPKTQPAEVDIQDPEEVLLGKLHQCMTVNALYREPTLTVSTLATYIGVSDKRLRDLINRRLQHKNFSSYVNAFRLEEVRARLLDPRHDHLPILTLALDAGFGSVVTFNRAFLNRFGTTPTECRSNRRASEKLN